MNNKKRVKISEKELKKIAQTHSDSYLFNLLSEHADELRRTRKKEEEAKERVLELIKILRLLNKILRHDILNDLTVIDINLNFYLKKNKERAIEDIKNAVKRSIETITKMGELESAVSSGVTLKNYRVRPIIESVCRDFSSLQFSIKGSASVKADEALRSVIENIVSNAAIHSGTKKVDINIKEERDGVEIQVADYGIGIPYEFKKEIFREGFKYGGTAHTGLGLYIVRKTVERYGGFVSVKDNKPKGTIFLLHFPKE